MAASITVLGIEARFAFESARVKRGLNFGSEPHTKSRLRVSMAPHNDQLPLHVHCVALLISLLTIWRSLLFALSFLALSCLIVDHLLCPDDKKEEVLRRQQVSQTKPPRGCRSSVLKRSAVILLFHAFSATTLLYTFHPRADGFSDHRGRWIRRDVVEVVLVAHSFTPMGKLVFPIEHLQCLPPTPPPHPQPPKMRS